ncbi:MAG: TonB-dependent receptor [Crocinitomicaceae bacterium]|nr:TonB-dependent receptor [Crocinitomicaceae bacterium]MBK8926276.1 TonB-dependent receptor [Crocinitomicaceae bacterium]
MKSCLIFFMFFLSAGIFCQQKFTLSGHVTSAQTGESLIGATVKVKTAEGIKGTIVNSYGFYSITLPQGDYPIEISFIGFSTISDTIILLSDIQRDFELKESGLLNEVEITAEASNDNITSTEMSKNELSIAEIKKLPALMGEVDIIKAIQLLPGVQSVGEGGSGFYVRGGAVDQNLILLDEANVYNASHLMGFFSVFNPDVVKDVQLYKGGIPAEYGGRLSSVLDIKMIDGNYKNFTAEGGIGTISSRATIGGPIVKDRGSFVISGRRTYADIFLNFSSKEELKNSTLYFYDANIKLNYKLNDNNRIYLSGYFGRDVFGIDSMFRMDWGNATATLRWNHVFSNKLFLNTTATFSNYDYFLGEPTGKEAYEWTSNIQDYYLKTDFSYFINPDNTLKFGGLASYHRIDPGMAVGTGVSILEEFVVSKTNGLEYAFYVSHKIKFNNRWTANYGLRYSIFQNIGPGTYYTYDENFKVKDTSEYSKGEVFNTYAGFEPRAGLTFVLNEYSSLKLSYNRTRQYIQLASNSTSSSPLDIWFPCSPNVKPQIADQIALGYFVNLYKDAYETSVEVYYKEMQNAIDFKDHATLLLNPYMEGELRFGRAWAYGSEFMVKKSTGKLTGWISYTLSRTQKQIDGINNNKPYLAKSDQTHNLSVTVSYEFSKQLSVSANFIYSTGSAVTMPIGKYEYMGMVIPLYSDRNAKRLPDYHRLDFAATWKVKQKEGKRWQSEWVFSVYNVYNRANAYQINFKQNPDNANETVAEMMYLFGIIPSITYNFKF